MSLSSSIRRTVLVATFALAVALLGGVGSAHAQGTFISAPNRADICYDDARGVLYISSGADVLRYDVAGERFIAPLHLGGHLAGMDLSPDGSTLAVADTDYSGAATLGGANDVNWVHLVDLDFGGDYTIEFDRVYGEGGTWQVAFDDQDELLVSTEPALSGPVPLRRYNLDTDDQDVLATLPGYASLSPSGDRSKIAFAPGDSGSSAWGVFTSADGSVKYGAPVDQLKFDIAANGDGTQFFLPGAVSSAFGADLSAVHTLGSMAGAKYSPDSTLLFVAPSGSATVTAYDTGSLAATQTFDFGSTFATPTWLPAFNWVRFAITPDNAAVFATVDGGVREVRTKPEVIGRVTSSFAGASISGARVEIWRAHGGVWSLDDTQYTNASGSWSETTTDTTPVRLRVTDPTGGHNPAWYGGIDLGSAANVIPSMEATPVQVQLTGVRGATLGGTVVDTEDGQPIEGVTVSVSLASSGSPVVRTASTSASGRYHLSDLGPGQYLIKFEKPGYDTTWWPYAGSPADAESLVIDSPGAYYAGSYLTHHVTACTLTPALMLGSSSATISVGVPVTLATTATDSNASGAALNAMPIVLQSSPDNSTWTTMAVGVTSLSGGVYHTTFVPSTQSRTYYRFQLGAAAYRLEAYSASISLRAVAGMYFNGPVTADGYPAIPSAGQDTAISAVLYSADGTLAPAHAVKLESSSDGVNFVDTGVAVQMIAPSVYRAVFSLANSASLRFTTVPAKGEVAVHSDVAPLWAFGAMTRWDDERGGPRLATGNPDVPYNSWAPITAILTGVTPTSAPTVWVEVSRDGLTYRTLGKATVGGAAVTKYGHLSGVRYNASIGPADVLKQYRFVADNSDPRGYSTSYQIPVRPEAWTGPPTIKGTLRAGRWFNVTGVVKPHVNGKTYYAGVWVKVLRMSGNSRKFVKQFKTKVFDSGQYSAYKTRLSLSRGTYRIEVHALGDGLTTGSQQDISYKKVVVR